MAFDKDELSLAGAGDEVGSLWSKAKKVGRKVGGAVVKYSPPTAAAKFAYQHGGKKVLKAASRYSKAALAAITSASMFPIRRAVRSGIMNTAMLYAKAGKRAQPNADDKKRATATYLAAMRATPGPKAPLLKAGAGLLKKFGTGISGISGTGIPGISGDAFVGYDEGIKDNALNSLRLRGKVKDSKVLSNELTGGGTGPDGVYVTGRLVYLSSDGKQHNVLYTTRIDPTIDSTSGVGAGADEVGGVIAIGGLAAAGIAAAILASGIMIAKIASAGAQRQIAAAGGQPLGPPGSEQPGAPGEGMAPDQGMPPDGGMPTDEGMPPDDGGMPMDEGMPEEGMEGDAVSTIMGGLCGASCYRKGL